MITAAMMKKKINIIDIIFVDLFII